MKSILNGNFHCNFRHNTDRLSLSLSWKLWDPWLFLACSFNIIVFFYFFVLLKIIIFKKYFWNIRTIIILRTWKVRVKTIQNTIMRFRTSPLKVQSWKLRHWNLPIAHGCIWVLPRLIGIITVFLGLHSFACKSYDFTFYCHIQQGYVPSCLFAIIIIKSGMKNF
jgi:hypothetical protein